MVEKWIGEYGSSGIYSAAVLRLCGAAVCKLKAKKSMKKGSISKGTGCGLQVTGRKVL
jgi:hypothetical protein